MRLCEIGGCRGKHRAKGLSSGAIIRSVGVGVWGLDVPVPPASAQSAGSDPAFGILFPVQVSATEQEHP